MKTKTFLMHAMMFVAVVMSVALLFSCSKDDEDIGGGGSNSIVGWYYTPKINCWLDVNRGFYLSKPNWAAYNTTGYNSVIHIKSDGTLNILDELVTVPTFTLTYTVNYPISGTKETSKTLTGEPVCSSVGTLYYYGGGTPINYAYYVVDNKLYVPDAGYTYIINGKTLSKSGSSLVYTKQ